MGGAEVQALQLGLFAAAAAAAAVTAEDSDLKGWIVGVKGNNPRKLLSHFSVGHLLSLTHSLTNEEAEVWKGLQEHNTFQPATHK